MKTYILATTFLVAGTAAAFAGNLQPAVTEPAPMAPVAVAPALMPSWQGAYAGAALTYGKGKYKADGDLEDALNAGGFGNDLGSPDGFGGAIRLGYDWQFRRTVLGLGASYDFGNYDDDSYVDAVGEDLHTKMHRLATVYGRAGYDMGKWMPYVLAGYTWGKGEASADGAGKTTFDLNGYTVGVGVEYRFAQHWTGFAEYKYTGFGSISDLDDNAKAHLNRINLGVNYRF